MSSEVTEALLGDRDVRGTGKNDERVLESDDDLIEVMGQCSTGAMEITF